MDVALGRAVDASVSANLGDTRTGSKGPVEEVPPGRERMRRYVAAASRGGWWSVSLLQAPTTLPRFRDFSVHVSTGEAFLAPSDLQVYLVEDFKMIDAGSSPTEAA